MRRTFPPILLTMALAASGCFGEASSPSATPPSATATPGPLLPSDPAATPSSSAADFFENYRWSQATIAVGDQTLISAIADTPVGLIAAGVNLAFPALDATFAPGQNPFSSWYSVVVWTSPDGRTWTQEPDSAQFGGGRPTAIAALGSSVLMFGIGGVCLPDACSGLPPNGGTIVWSSADGHSWERLVDTGLDDGAVTDVAVVDGGLVAVGYVANDGSKPDTDQFSDPTDAAVWRSSDGMHWDQVQVLPVADSLSSIRSFASTLVALASKESGTLVVWTSDDGGDTWSEGDSISDFWRSLAIASDGRMVVVTDTNGDRIDGIVYARPDAIGGQWKRLQPSNMRGFRPEAVVWAGKSFVIFGWRSHRDGALAVDDQQQTFSSMDGTEWVLIGLPPGWAGQAPMSVIEHDGHLIALLGILSTVNGPPTDFTYTIWTGTASN